jgi:hypothetical protein
MDICGGVVEKHYFCGILWKIPQNSDFTKKQYLNPVPNGWVAADIAKSKKNCKNCFLHWKTLFSQKSDRQIAKFPTPNCKNRIPQKTFIQFSKEFLLLFNFFIFFSITPISKHFFVENADFHKKLIFAKTPFFA